MANDNWLDLDFIDEEEFSEEKKTKVKTRKRKWREIENIKEQRRLRRDLAQYEHAYD